MGFGHQPQGTSSTWRAETNLINLLPANTTQPLYMHKHTVMVAAATTHGVSCILYIVNHLLSQRSVPWVQHTMRWRVSCTPPTCSKASSAPGNVRLMASRKQDHEAPAAGKSRHRSYSEKAEYCTQHQQTVAVELCCYTSDLRIAHAGH